MTSGNTENAPLLSNDPPEFQSTGKRSRTPLPKFQLLLLCLTRLVEPVAYTQIFPYVNDMCLRMGFAQSEKEVGFVSGLLDSTFAAVQLFTVLQWGRLSDRIGRRRVLICGLVGIACCTALFGLSRTLWMAILTRCLAGAISGNGVVIQSMISEITDDSNEAQAFPLYSLMYSIGSIIGPFIGGALARPTEQFPNLFSGIRLWEHYPYLLPCLASAAITGVAVATSFFFLHETLPSKVTEQKTPLPSCPSYSADTMNPVIRTADVSLSTWAMLRNPAIPDALVTCFLMMFTYQAWDVLFILFAYTSTELGGLSMSNSEIGYCLAIAGVIGTFIQLFVFPPLDRMFGMAMYPYLLSILVLIYGAAPFLNRLRLVAGVVQDQAINAAAANTYIGVAVLLTLSRVAAMLFPLNMILIKRATPSKAGMGASYGLFAVVTSAARAISPWFVSSLFAVSVEKRLLGGQLVWFVMIIITMVGVGFSYRVGERIKQSSEVVTTYRGAPRTED